MITKNSIQLQSMFKIYFKPHAKVIEGA